MAQDLKDPGTLELLPVPKKRGRKPTGNAMTPAERQAAYRQRMAFQNAGADSLERWLRADIENLTRRLKSSVRDHALVVGEMAAAVAENIRLKEELAQLRGR